MSDAMSFLRSSSRNGIGNYKDVAPDGAGEPMARGGTFRAVCLGLCAPPSAHAAIYYLDGPRQHV
jgi:hypothetical protein